MLHCPDQGKSRRRQIDRGLLLASSRGVVCGGCVSFAEALTAGDAGQHSADSGVLRSKPLRGHPSCGCDSLIVTRRHSSYYNKAHKVGIAVSASPLPPVVLVWCRHPNSQPIPMTSYYYHSYNYTPPQAWRLVMCVWVSRAFTQSTRCCIRSAAMCLLQKKTRQQHCHTGDGDFEGCQHTCTHNQHKNIHTQ